MERQLSEAEATKRRISNDASHRRARDVYESPDSFDGIRRSPYPAPISYVTQQSSARVAEAFPKGCFDSRARYVIVRVGGAT